MTSLPPGVGRLGRALRARFTGEPRVLPGVARGASFGQRAGLTLVEMVGVVAIVALLFSAAALSIQNLTRVGLRGEAHKLSANIQALYNRAVTNGVYLRMVFDLDEDRYWSEVAENRFFLGAVKEEDEDTPLFKEKDAKATQEGEVQTLEVAEGPAMHQASAQEIKDSLIKRVELGRGVELSGIMTTHQREVRREGKGYLYFFPDGYVEKALVYLSDGEITYTVETQPLTGRVRVHRGEVEPGEEFQDQEDDDDD